MAIIQSLSEIEIYKTSLLLAQKIYKLMKLHQFSREYSLCDQIKRAALSICANIAEGFGRKTHRDFAQFLSIALGSTNEVIAYLDFIQLEFGIDTSLLKDEYLQLSKRIFTFRKYLLTHK